MILTFICLVGLYAFVARKVDYWVTIDLLGFRSETPILFMRSKWIYHVSSLGLFISTVVVGINSPVPVWIVVPGMMMVWLLTVKSGHSAAYRKYREILHSLKELSDTPAEKAEIDSKIAKSDAALSSDVMAASKRRRRGLNW